MATAANSDSQKVKEIRKRFDEASEYWQTQFSKSADDLKMCSHDNQWPADVKTARLGRPCYTADRLNAQVKSLTNAQRENRPACTVHAVNDEADEDTAEVIQGLFRHMDYIGDSDQAIDTASDWQIRVGLGFWRIIPRYIDDNSFDQELVDERISNPFAVLMDPNFKRADGGDMGYAFIIDWMPQEEFKLKYPSAKMASLNTAQWIAMGSHDPKWVRNGDSHVQVVEHFWIEEEPHELYRLTDGSFMDEATFKAQKAVKKVNERSIEQKRTVYTKTIRWYKLCANEILEETTFPGEIIPLIPVFGDELMEGDKHIYSGVVRRQKEEQMMLNVLKTTAVEMVAAMPKQPWIAPVGALGDRKIEWQEANIRNLQVLEYDPFDYQERPLNEPHKPNVAPELEGILALIQSTENDLKATPALYDPAMGNKMSADQSGIAIKALQTAGSIGNYHFSDNLSRAIKLCARIRLGVLKYYYNRTRVVRIIGLDDTHKLVTVNGTGSPDETGCMDDKGVAKVYDLTTGQYDITVSSGPSYQTKREQDVATMLQMAHDDPTFLPQAKDLLVGEMDSPIATQLRDRFQKFLPPGILPPDPDNPQKTLPPEVQQGMQQDHQMIQALQQKLQEATNELQKTQMEFQAKAQMNTENNQTKLEIENMRVAHSKALESFLAETKLIHSKFDKNHEMVMNMLNKSNQAVNGTPDNEKEV